MSSELLQQYPLYAPLGECLIVSFCITDKHLIWTEGGYFRSTEENHLSQKDEKSLLSSSLASVCVFSHQWLSVKSLPCSQRRRTSSIDGFLLMTPQRTHASAGPKAGKDTAVSCWNCSICELRVWQNVWVKESLDLFITHLLILSFQSLFPAPSRCPAPLPPCPFLLF